MWSLKDETTTDKKDILNVFLCISALKKQLLLCSL